MKRLSVLDDIPPGPRHVYMSVHLPCNLRCVQCHMYKQTNPPDGLTLDEHIAVLEELAAFSPRSVVILAGGEVLARRRHVYPLADAAERLGIPLVLVTNGTLFQPTDFERICAAGFVNVTFSFDSDQADVHDRIRGRAGTFERARQSLRSMIRARDATPRWMQVMGSAIVHRDNLDRLEPIVDWLESEGVDGINFNAITATLAAELSPTWWQDDLFPDDHDAIDRGMDTLVRLVRAGRRIVQSEAKIEDMRRYLKHPQQLETGHCGAWQQTMMIDMRGDVRLCFEMERAGLEPIGNVRRDRLRDLWPAPATLRAREVMAGCREGCGAQNCHAR